jgi:hypothetical protein
MLRRWQVNRRAAYFDQMWRMEMGRLGGLNGWDVDDMLDPFHKHEKQFEKKANDAKGCRKCRLRERAREFAAAETLRRFPDELTWIVVAELGP